MARRQERMGGNTGTVDASTHLVVVADAKPQFREKAAAALDGHRTCEDAVSLDVARRIVFDASNNASVLVLGPSLPVDEALDLAAEIQDRSLGVSVILVASKVTTALLKKAIRSGIRDVLPASCAAKQFRDAVARAEGLASERLGVAAGSTSNGRVTAARVITVFSAKGGSGKSVLASNLAMLVGRRSRSRVALVDLDLESGDLAIMFRADPRRTMFDVAQNIQRLDAEALTSYMTPLGNGVDLLAAPLEPGLAEKITPDAVRAILRMLREIYPVIVVDGPSFFTEQVLAALDESDEVALIATLDVPSVKNMKVALRTLGILGFEKHRIRLVLNRADSRVGLSVDEVQKTLKTKIGTLVPSSGEVPLSVNRGVPISEVSAKSKVTVAFEAFAGLVAGEPAPTNGRTSRFRMFAGKGR